MVDNDNSNRIEHLLLQYVDNIKILNIYDNTDNLLYVKTAKIKNRVIIDQVLYSVKVIVFLFLIFFSDYFLVNNDVLLFHGLFYARYVFEAHCLIILV